MYYVLNYIPSIIQTIIFFVYFQFGFVFDSQTRKIYLICLLLATPIYLVIINAIYWTKRNISYTRSILCMLSVIVFNVLCFIITHKIQTGYFIGDVPIELYYSMIGIPSAIIIVGMVIIFLIKKQDSKTGGV